MNDAIGITKQNEIENEICLQSHLSSAEVICLG